MHTTHHQNGLLHRDPYGVAFAGLLMLLFFVFAIASLF